MDPVRYHTLAQQVAQAISVLETWRGEETEQAHRILTGSWLVLSEEIDQLQTEVERQNRASEGGWGQLWGSLLEQFDEHLEVTRGAPQAVQTISAYQRILVLYAVQTELYLARLALQSHRAGTYARALDHALSLLTQPALANSHPALRVDLQALQQTKSISAHCRFRVADAHLAARPMKLLALIFVALLVTGLAAWSVQVQGGEVIVHIADLTVRASLLMAALTGIGAMFGIFLLVWLLSRTLETPSQLRRHRDMRRNERARTLLEKGMRLLLEGQTKAAREALEQAVRIDPGQPLFRALAAQADIQAKDPDSWNAHLRAISDPAWQAACTRLRADGLMAAGKWEEALAVLQVLSREWPTTENLLEKIAHCHRRLGSWRRLLTLAQDPETMKNVAAEERLGWLREAARQLCAADDADPKALQEELGDARQDPEVARCYEEACARQREGVVH